MARQSAMVINREAMHEIDAAMVKGLEYLAMEVLQTAKPPDASTGYSYIGDVKEPRRADEGLVERGAFLSYLDGKKVGGDWHLVKRKPQAFKVRGMGASVAVGYSFPARFNEMGTVRQPPRPFFTPAVMEVVGNRSAVEQAMYISMKNLLTKKALKLQRQHNLGPRELLGRSER